MRKKVTHKMKQRTNYLMIATKVPYLIAVIVAYLSFTCSNSSSRNCALAATASSFPGVSRDLASFCAARPSLPIELAAMVVHVKKSISFNYKLYLFSADGHVFQTGQVIPRDDFRIHSFPVKVKRTQEFWPPDIPTFRYANSSADSLLPVSSNEFNLKHFLRLTPLKGNNNKISTATTNRRHHLNRRKPKQPVAITPPDDHHLLSEGLPGDSTFVSHDVALAVEHNSNNNNNNPNKHIHFDRDDQVSLVSRNHLLPTSEYLTSGSGDSEQVSQQQQQRATGGEFARDAVMPVAAFSSFHVNLTYLVRKDFGQVEPELVRLQVDAPAFQVSQLVLISSGGNRSSSNNGFPANGDYDFLSHKLLRNENTRITAISQIYEDWIMRNFYTLVYIQRRSSSQDQSTGSGGDDSATGGDSSTSSSSSSSSATTGELINDRLVFRGSSAALLGADQLDYAVKAAAFITEKNGLHYYLEFLDTAKFYLCAVDWTKRPFRMIDSRRFPMRATRVQLDNEELLLCPPAVCYSQQPVDELVAYGRIALPEHQTRALQKLTQVAGAATGRTQRLSVETNSTKANLNETNLVYLATRTPTGGRLHERQVAADNATSDDQEVDLKALVEAIKLGANQLQTRLHLRDWLWVLSRQQAPQMRNQQQQVSSTATAAIAPPPVFELRYELARRNDIKVKPDTYGYLLTGSEIEASYRIYNELYLISANHLITINYTLANETVISSQPLSDEFQGLSSTLVDPITGAYYDRYDNQIYFFKGDRYVGYDYATKKPLPDFVLQESSLMSSGVGMFAELTGAALNANHLVSSLPVVGILGRQHQVDAIYHDFASDAVYVFTGMRFYLMNASEFKNGTFTQSGKGLPAMHCINEHFLAGCTFDEAFKNPCRSAEDSDDNHVSSQSGNTNTSPLGKLELPPEVEAPADEVDTGVDITGNNNNQRNQQQAANFSEQQQMKLRSIASTRSGLLKLFVQNSLLSREAARAIEPALIVEQQVSQQDTSPVNQQVVHEQQVQEKTMVLYLLTAMIALTVLVTVVLIVVVINWTKVRLARNSSATSATGGGDNHLHHQTALPNQQVLTNSGTGNHLSGSHYLANQQHHSRRQQQQQQHRHQQHRSSRNSHHLPGKPLGQVSVVVAKSSGAGSRHSSHRQMAIDNSVL